MKLLFFLMMTASLSSGAEDPPKIEKAAPKNGVFVSYTGYMTTVVELKDGRFRYWFDSDVKMEKEPDYPLTGKYSITGEVIELEHDQVFQKKWTFRSVGGIVTLWRDDALKIEAGGTPFTKYYPLGFANFRRCGAGAILVEAKRPAESAWTERQVATVSEEQRQEMEKK